VFSDNSEFADSSEGKHSLIQPLEACYLPVMVLSKIGVLTKFGKITPGERWKYRYDNLAEANAIIAK
jgi:hypothetical protein